MPVTIYNPTPEHTKAANDLYAKQLARRLQDLIDTHTDEEIAQMIAEAKIVHPEWFLSERTKGRPTR